MPDIIIKLTLVPKLGITWLVFGLTPALPKPPPKGTEYKVPTKPLSCCLAPSQVTTRVLAFQASDYGCMVGMCVQLIYRLRVTLVCYSNAGLASFLDSFVFIVCACDSVQQLLGPLQLSPPPSPPFKMNRQVYCLAPCLTLCHWIPFIHAEKYTSAANYCKWKKFEQMLFCLVASSWLHLCFQYVVGVCGMTLNVQDCSSR